MADLKKININTMADFKNIKHVYCLQTYQLNCTGNRKFFLPQSSLICWWNYKRSNMLIDNKMKMQAVG